MQQGTGALFYVVPYICKNKVTLEACLAALEAAQSHVEQYPSAAEDAGTAKQYVQHMFTKVLNDLACSIEVNDTQVALLLLNMGQEITSDTYQFFGADNSVNYFLYQFLCHQHHDSYQHNTESVYSLDLSVSTCSADEEEDLPADFDFFDDSASFDSSACSS